MNTLNNPFRLIIINDSQEEAQRLASMFQNAGKPCRAQFIDKEEALSKIINEQSWELAIVYKDNSQVTPAAAIRCIRQAGCDLPMITLSEDTGERTVIDGMKVGACDVVQLDDDQHLLLVVSRELEYRDHRKKTRQIERKLKETERHNQQLLDNSKDGIAFIQDGLFIYANDSFAEMLGYDTRDDVESLPLMDIVAEEDQEDLKHALKNFPLEYGTQKTKFITFHCLSPEGQPKKVDIELKLANYEEESCIQFLLASNFADSEVLEAEIQNMRYTDSTTGLNNKAYLLNELAQAIQCTSEGNAQYAFFYIDIDNYKDVEEQLGLSHSEMLLAEVAKILISHSSQNDTMARVGEHAFAMVAEKQDIEKMLNIGDILSGLVRNQLFDINHHTLKITISVGITMITELTVDPQTVINQATQAIESLRKRNGDGVGDGANFYQESTSDDQPILASVVQNAVKNNQFKALFQPIISLRGESQELYEVLVRMLDENQEEISPDLFLQAANDMKVTTKIDRWVVLETVKHLANHQEDHQGAHLMVNLSSHTLCDQSFFPWLKVALNAAKVNPAAITFQAKEADINQHLNAAKQFIEQAQSIGISFSVSHFGCAINAFSLFDHIATDQIKIDGSFSTEVQENPDNTEALEALFKELQEHNKVITVPMVENANILSKLWKLGAHYIQGYYLQPPSPAMDYDFSVDN